MQQFDFSQNALKKRQRFLWIVVLASEPVVFLVVLLTTDVKTSILLPAFGVAAVLTIGLVAAQMRSMNRSLRGMQVVIKEDGIVKHHTGGEQNLAWGDVVGVDVAENPQGDCVYIKLLGKDKNTIHL